MNQYEITFIVDPVLSGGEINTTAQSYVDHLQSEGCKIVHVDEMGLKQLAYPINKKTTGVYYCLEFTSETGLVIEKIELAFRRDERIMRFLSVKLDKYGVKYNEDKRNGLIGKVQEKKNKKVDKGVKKEVVIEDRKEAKKEVVREDRKEAKKEVAIEDKKEAKKEAAIEDKKEAAIEGKKEVKEEVVIEDRKEVKKEVVIEDRKEAKKEVAIEDKKEAKKEVAIEDKKEAANEVKKEVNEEVAVTKSESASSEEE